MTVSEYRGTGNSASVPWWRDRSGRPGTKARSSGALGPHTLLSLGLVAAGAIAAGIGYGLHRKRSDPRQRMSDSSDARRPSWRKLVREVPAAAHLLVAPFRKVPLA